MAPHLGLPKSEINDLKRRLNSGELLEMANNVRMHAVSVYISWLEVFTILPAVLKIICTEGPLYIGVKKSK